MEFLQPKTDCIFHKAAPDINASFVYDKIDKVWKVRWYNDPDRYIGYTQISGDPFSIFELVYLRDELNDSHMEPLETVTLKAVTA